MIDDQDQKLQALRERVRELNVEVTPWSTNWRPSWPN